MSTKTKRKSGKTTNSTKNTAVVIKKKLEPKKSVKKRKGTPDKVVEKPAKPEVQSEDFIAFLCSELVYWLTNPTQLLAGHRLLNRDAIVEAQGLTRPSILDLKERYLDSEKVLLRQPFSYSTDKTSLVKGAKPFYYKVVITESIPTQVFRKGDFSGNDFNRYSYAHYYLLMFMLKLIDERFRQFVFALNHAMQNRHAVENAQSDPLIRSSANLESLIRLLRKQNEGYIGISLPDLFALDPQSAILTQDLNYLAASNPEGRKSKKVYTYMYSKDTSQAFCEVLAEKIDQKLKNLNAEIKPGEEAQSNLLIEYDIANWLKKIPKTNSKERMKLALQILGLRTEENMQVDKVRWTAGELMLIFRAFENSGVIVPGLEITKLAVAMEILTGKTHLKFQEKYHLTAMKPLDINKICEVKSEHGSRRNIKKLVDQIKAALDNLVEETRQA